MQIIIPMTGYGSRFVAAGYKDLKPLIKVYGKPIIWWIINGMFHYDDEFIFICRKEHLDTIDSMHKYLQSLSKNITIVPIDNWEKKGPVFDVMRAADYIDDESPSIINYCDFYMNWDYLSFKNMVNAKNIDGAIPCYTGFHPSLIPQKNVYASCRYDNEENLIEIREKYSFSEDKFKASHSAGTYYFKTGSVLKKYCQKLIDDGNTLNGEFYASLPYNYMVKDGLKVWVANIVEYFCQWGTPEDLQEFLFWNNIIKGWNK